VSSDRPSPAEPQFEQLLEFAPDGMVGVDRSGKIMVVNHQAELMFGYPRCELIGQPVERLVPERFRGDHRRHRLGYTKDPHTRPMGASLSLFGLRKDGTEFPAEISLSSIRTEAGSLTMTAIRDITDRLHAEATAEAELHRRAIIAAMLSAEEAERSRIATALHDDTVQVMTASMLMLDRVAQGMAPYGDADLQALIERARRVVAEATERTRRLTFELRPAVLHECGIARALTAMVEQAGREIGAETSVSATSERFHWSLEELVYRIMQEAVANIRKHSGARHITVSVDHIADRLAGLVADDGRGFDVARAIDPSSQILHMGMQTMIERVRIAGGSINVDSHRGHGTRISFQVPVTHAA
jgi:two-component system, NarL family, sensor histidine kinase DevS